MSDYAVVALLAILAPVLAVGVLANLALWFSDKPLPYDEDYEREQRRDRLYLERVAKRSEKQVG